MRQHKQTNTVHWIQSAQRALHNDAGWNQDGTCSQRDVSTKLTNNVVK